MPGTNGERETVRALFDEFGEWLEREAPRRLSALDLLHLAPPHLRGVAWAVVEYDLLWGSGGPDTSPPPGIMGAPWVGVGAIPTTDLLARPDDAISRAVAFVADHRRSPPAPPAPPGGEE
jgi:hypothetical protein